MIDYRYQRRFLFSFFLIFALTNCATTDDHNGKTIGTIAGAALGAGIAAALGQDPLAGAAIGAAGGFLVGSFYDYSVKKIKEAPEVENEYKKNHGGFLPSETVITKYTTRTNPTDLVNRGGELNFLSELEVIKGTNPMAKNNKISEELKIYNDFPDSSPITSKKDINIDDNSSGVYETNLTFQFRADENLEQGIYRYKKTLYLNDEQVKESEGKFQVAIVDQKTKMAFLDE